LQVLESGNHLATANLHQEAGFSADIDCFGEADLPDCYGGPAAYEDAVFIPLGGHGVLQLLRSNVCIRKQTWNDDADR
jgi:hypothetical protein